MAIDGNYVKFSLKYEDDAFLDGDAHQLSLKTETLTKTRKVKDATHQNERPWLYMGMVRLPCPNCKRKGWITEPKIFERISGNTYIMERCIFCGETRRSYT